MKTFPVIKDLVTDVSWNYEVNKRSPAFQPREGAEWKWQQHDIDRAQEFRKCIECFLCQDVCHVLRSHELKHQFAGPRFFVRIAALEMHPIDGADRLKDTLGHRAVQHHEVLHRGVRRTSHHRQRDHPAQGAGVDRYDPDRDGVGGMIAGRGRAGRGHRSRRAGSSTRRPGRTAYRARGGTAQPALAVVANRGRLRGSCMWPQRMPMTIQSPAPAPAERIVADRACRHTGRARRGKPVHSAVLPI